jgi:hypothetical protein
VQRVIAAAATADLDYPARVRGLELAPGTLAQAPTNGPADVVTAFDSLDRAPDVDAFERVVHAALRPGGLLFLTAPTSSGFELQLLWDRSPSLVPPDKLNLLSIEALEALFAAPRWELIEISTPGVLDVELVRGEMLRDPTWQWPRFMHYLLTQRDEAALLSFQEYLQRYRLTSFARVLARRK